MCLDGCGMLLFVKGAKAGCEIWVVLSEPTSLELVSARDLQPTWYARVTSLGNLES